jgi:hypothetical protein
MAQHLTPTTHHHYTRSSSALWRRTNDAVVLLGAGDREPITLTGPAARIWDVLAGPTGWREACDALGFGHSNSEAARAQEVAQLLDELERRGLVDAYPAP